MMRFLTVLLLGGALWGQEQRPTQLQPFNPTSPCYVVSGLWNNWLLGVIWQCKGSSHTAKTGTWQLISGSGGAWGAITGTLSNQTDLAAALAGKQALLGFTPENIANKSTDGTLAANSDTLYASQKATKTYADTKQPALGFTAENIANKDTDGTLAANSDIKYPSQKAVKTYVDAHSGVVTVGESTTSSTIHVFGTNCTSSLLTNPCIFQFGDDPKIYTSILSTATVSAGTGHVYIYMIDGGPIVGYGTGFSAGNITGTGATFGISAFPTNSTGKNLYDCTVTAGTWDVGGCTNLQAVLAVGKQIICSACTESATSITIPVSSGGGGAITPDFKGVTIGVTNTASPVTIYTTTISSLAAGACFDISAAGTVPAVSTRVDIYVDATLIATAFNGLNTQSFGFNYTHCNLPSVTNSQQTFPTTPVFYAPGSASSLTNVVGSNVDGLQTTSAIDWTSSHAVTLKTTAASGDTIGRWWRLR